MNISQFTKILNFNRNVSACNDALYINCTCDKTEIGYIYMLCDEFGIEVIEKTDNNDTIHLKLREER